MLQNTLFYNHFGVEFASVRLCIFLYANKDFNLADIFRISGQESESEVFVDMEGTLFPLSSLGLLGVIHEDGPGTSESPLFLVGGADGPTLMEVELLVASTTSSSRLE